MRRFEPAGAARRRLRRALAATLCVVLPGVATGAVGSAAATAPLAVASPLPTTCAPNATEAATVPSIAAMHVTTHGAHRPLKDVAIQPGFLPTPQWTSLLDLARAAGVGVVKVALDWSSFEPTGPNAPPDNWSTFEAFIAAAHARGIAVRFQLEGFPTWARDAGDPTDWWYSPRSSAELARWATWIRSVVSTFGTSVSFYEIWNEENYPSFWPGGPDPAQYAALLACTYVAAKSVNPDVRIVSGGLSQNDVGYLGRLYDSLSSYPYAKANHYFFDVLGVHPYSGGRSPAVNSTWWVGPETFGEVDANFLGYTQLESLMVSRGDPGKQMYFGEYGAPVEGYPALDTVGFTQVPESTRARWVGLAYRLASRTPYVIGMSWFTLYSEATWALLRNPNGTTDATTTWIETPSFHALSRVPSAYVTGLSS